MEARCQVVLIAKNFLHFRVVDVLSHLVEGIDLNILAITSRVIVPIKGAPFLLPESHEDDWTFIDDRVDDQGGEDDDEDGHEGQAEVELAPSYIPIRVLKEEATSLDSAHLASALLDLQHDLLLLGKLGHRVLFLQHLILLASC